MGEIDRIPAEFGDVDLKMLALLVQALCNWHLSAY